MHTDRHGWSWNILASLQLNFLDLQLSFPTFIIYPRSTYLTSFVFSASSGTNKHGQHAKAGPWSIVLLHASLEGTASGMLPNHLTPLDVHVTAPFVICLLEPFVAMTQAAEQST